MCLMFTSRILLSSYIRDINSSHLKHWRVVRNCASPPASTLEGLGWTEREKKKKKKQNTMHLTPYGGRSAASGCRRHRLLRFTTSALLSESNPLLLLRRVPLSRTQRLCASVPLIERAKAACEPPRLGSLSFGVGVESASAGCSQSVSAEKALPVLAPLLAAPDNGALDALFFRSGWVASLLNAPERAPASVEVVGRSKVMRFLVWRWLQHPALWRDAAEEVLEEALRASRCETSETARDVERVLEGAVEYLHRPPSDLIFYSPSLARKLLCCAMATAVADGAATGVIGLWETFVLAHRDDASLLPAPHLPPFSFGDVVHHISSADFLPVPRVTDTEGKEAPHVETERSPALPSDQQWSTLSEAEQNKYLFGTLSASLATKRSVQVHEGVFVVTYGFDREVTPSENPSETDPEDTGAVARRRGRPPLSSKSMKEEEEEVEEEGAPSPAKYAIDNFYMGIIDSTRTAVGVTRTEVPEEHAEESPSPSQEQVGPIHPVFRRQLGHLRRRVNQLSRRLPPPPNGWLESQGLFVNAHSGAREDVQLSLLWQAFQMEDTEELLGLFRLWCTASRAVSRDVLGELLGQTCLLLLFFSRPEVRALTPPEQTYAQVRYLHETLLFLLHTAAGLGGAAPLSLLPREAMEPPFEPFLTGEALDRYRERRVAEFNAFPEPVKRSYAFFSDSVPFDKAREEEEEPHIASSNSKSTSAAHINLQSPQCVPASWTLPDTALLNQLAVFNATNQMTSFVLDIGVGGSFSEASPPLTSVLVRLKTSSETPSVIMAVRQAPEALLCAGAGAAEASVTVLPPPAQLTRSSSQTAEGETETAGSEGPLSKRSSDKPRLPKANIVLEKRTLAGTRKSMKEFAEPDNRTSNDAVPMKRGRGRPRKQASASEFTADVVSNADTVPQLDGVGTNRNELGSTAAEPVKRGRGRPRKQASASEFTADVVSNADTVPQLEGVGTNRNELDITAGSSVAGSMKRGRGRPRKQASASEFTTDVVSNAKTVPQLEGVGTNRNELDTTAGSSAAEPVKRGRGRPRKQASATEFTTDVVSNANTVPQLEGVGTNRNELGTTVAEPVKRGRGRSKKGTTTLNPVKITDQTAKNHDVRADSTPDGLPPSDHLDAPVKRHRGRPRKHHTASVDEGDSEAYRVGFNILLEREMALSRKSGARKTTAITSIDRLASPLRKHGWGRSTAPVPEAAPSPHKRAKKRRGLSGLQRFRKREVPSV